MDHFTSQRDEQLESVKWPLSNRGSNCCILMFFCYRSLSQTFGIHDAETDQIMRDDDNRVETANAILSSISCAQMGIHQKPTFQVHPFLPTSCSNGAGLLCRRKVFIVDQTRLLGSGLALGAGLTAGLDALQDGLTVLVELELGDDDVGRVDAERDGLARGLLAGDTLDVDHVLETVDGSDLALLVLVAATDNGDLVVLADGDAADLFVGTPQVSI